MIPITMFKGIIDSHQKSRAEKAQKLMETQTKIVDKSLPAVNQALFAMLNGPEPDLAAAQVEIAAKCKKVREDWHNYLKEVERWLIFANNLEVLLDEIGDVESWAHSARADIETTFGELREKKD
jgi:hypothetical protein